MSLFESLKFRYENRFCRIDQLKQFVELRAITEDEFFEITGEPYSNEDEQ